MSRSMRHTARMRILSLVLLFNVVLADCECGYTANVNSSNVTNPTSWLFTDVLESDFFHIDNITLDTDWYAQNYSMTPEAALGPYGINYTLSQVTINHIADPKNWTGPGELGGDPGLRLTVDAGTPKDGYVKTGQVDSARTDMLWGTYRASMKLTATNGTCAAFFWYFDDSQEIDMEFLSDQFNFTNGTFPVNLVLQANKNIKSGFNSADTGNYRRVNLPFDPTTSYHEYRIDYVPGSIVFYADTEVLTRFDASTIPFSPGHLIVTHWSNGNILWSAGPPVKNAILSVGYVKAYFNSSLPKRHSDWAQRCKDPSLKTAICVIPDQNTAPDPTVVVENSTSAEGNFFSNNDNQTVNQTVYQPKKSPAKRDVHGGYTTLGTIVLGLLVFLFLFH